MSMTFSMSAKQRESHMMKHSVSRVLVIALGLAAVATPAHADKAWSGAYLGAHGGYAWGDVDQTQTSGGMPPGPFSYKPSGGFGGLTAGFNLQAGKLVAGLEADAGYMDLSGAGIIPSSAPPAHQDITLAGGLYGDITARLGVAWDRALVYGKGGFAYYDGQALQKTTNPGFVSYGTSTFAGWVAGGGIEYAVSPVLSLKVEYLHFDFGKRGGNQTSITDDPVGYVYTNSTDVTADTVKVGVNYRF